MHILIIAPEQIPVPPVKGGSVEICILAIARQLAKLHTVTVISKRTSGYPNVTRIGKLTIERVVSGSSAKYLQSVAAAIKGRRFDVIQVDNRPRFLPIIKSLFPRTPVSLFLHSLTFVSPSHISRNEAANCMKYADFIIANSKSLRMELVNKFPQVQHKIKFAYLGVDSNRFRQPSPNERKSSRTKLGLNGKFVVAFAGRIIPRKGLPVLVRAIHKVKKKVPHVHLLVAGSPYRKGHVKQVQYLANQLKVPMKMAGYYSHRQIHRFYWAADCLVCPSQKHEAFGLVNVEAMSTGVPVIASHNGGIAEIIQHEKTGILVKRYSDPSAFASAIIGLAGNPELSSRIRKNGLSRARNVFSWHGTAVRLSKIYKMSN